MRSKKVVIRKESELKKWFIENYKKLGYSKIVRKDIGECPDLIMLKNGQKIGVELETVASNFLLHKHDLNKVDEIVCVIKDVSLGKPVINISELKFIGSPNVKVTLSINRRVYTEFQKFCQENAIMLSRKLEIEMLEIMKQEKEGRK